MKIYSICLFAVLFLFGSARSDAQTVLFETSLGEIVVELFPEEAPISVANFLNYLNDGDYDGSFFHRSVPGFVVQGGGFTIVDNGTSNVITPIPEDPPIQNEPGISNTRGTIAFARTSEVNSATNQFFFNVEDNSANLDVQNEGFTVFGEVVTGLEVVDAINALTIVDASSISPALNELPLLPSFQPGDSLEVEDFVFLSTVSIVAVPEPGSIVLLSTSVGFVLLRRRRKHPRTASVRN